MGACSFINTVRAASPAEGFSKLVAEARAEYGNDPYSGTIATTDFSRKVKVIATRYSSTSARKGYEYAEDKVGDVPKWSCDCVDLGIAEYRRVRVVPQKTEKKKIPARYRVIPCGCYPETSFSTKAEAEKFAAKNALKLCVAHQIVKDFGNEYLSTVGVEVKISRTKPLEIKNSRVETIHEYIFYGIAGE